MPISKKILLKRDSLEKVIKNYSVYFQIQNPNPKNLTKVYFLHMRYKNLLSIGLLLIILLLIPMGYFLLQEEKKPEILKIAPIEIEELKPPTQKSENSGEHLSKPRAIPSNEIFSQFEKAVQDSKIAASNEEIAKNVVMALEKSVHKTIPQNTTTVYSNLSEINISESNTSHNKPLENNPSKSHLTQETKTKNLEQAEKVKQAKKKEKVALKEETKKELEVQKVNSKPKVDTVAQKSLVQVNTKTTPTIVTEKIQPKPAIVVHQVLKNQEAIAQKEMSKIEEVPKEEVGKDEELANIQEIEQNLPRSPKIILVSKDSHASITNVNTLIEDTHPEETLEIYNGAKAYLLDESAETQEISITQEEFEQLPWSETYGVIEESESFALEE